MQIAWPTRVVADPIGEPVLRRPGEHRAAFREALSMRPDEVYLLTDADDLQDADLRVVMPASPVRISAVVFGGNRPAAGTPLERLAERTGGKVQYVGQ